MRTYPVVSPGDLSLRTPLGWSALGGDRYGTVRHQFIVVEGEADATLEGPPAKGFDRVLPVNAQVKKESKTALIVSNTESVQDTMVSAASNKLSTEMLAQASSGSQLDLKGALLSASASLSAKTSTELIESVQSQLSTTSTHSVTFSKEDLDSLSFSVPEDESKLRTRRVIGFLRYRKHWWDVYLHASEVFVFDYVDPLIGFDSRRTHRRDRAVLDKPLFRVEFFVPEPGLSIVYGTHTATVTRPEEIRVVEAHGRCPPWRFPAPTALEDLAQQAFPTPRERKALKKPGPKPPARKVSAKKKAAPKKAPAKKAAPKKAPAKQKAAPKAR